MKKSQSLAWLYGKLQNYRMHNENISPNIIANPHHNTDPSTKLATLLVIVVSFQEKIEILKKKLCGHSSFSPALYFQLMDLGQKSYIDTEDLITYVKKSKPNFNIDSRYLKAMFKKFNQDDRVAGDRMTYFGYLNLIKPHFQNKLASEVLMRDSVITGNSYNEAVKKTFDELLCTTYACVAEHQKVKELIIVGDIQQGGVDEGQLYNIGEIMKILTEKRNEGGGGRSGKHKTTLDQFHDFILANSEYEIEREEMKYILAYLLCHEYQISGEKYLSILFMPVALNYNASSTPARNARTERTVRNLSARQAISYEENFVEMEHHGGSRTNFLDYVHPNSGRDAHISHSREPESNGPEIIISSPHQKREISHRSLNNHISNPEKVQTPFLEKFLRESKVLKNMSRYRPEVEINESAFIQSQDHEYIPVAREHIQKPINKDFNLEQVLMSSNLHQSEYQGYLNQSRAPPMGSIRERNEREEDQGFLNKFLLK